MKNNTRYLKKILKRAAYTLFSHDFVDAGILARNYLINKKREKQLNKKNKRFIEKLLARTQPLKLELGSCRRPDMEDWTFLDISENSDLQMDLSRPLPFPDNCATQIYSSHLIEHFSYPNPLLSLLGECYRILEINGIFSVAVPNAKIYLSAYLSEDNFDYKYYCQYDSGLSFKSRIDYVNHIAYMGGYHKHLFDEKNLQIVMSDVGFRDVHIRDFDPKLDLEGRRFQTIYAEGKK